MDIKHVNFRIDGESNGVELCDIDLGNGYRECSNWNLDLHQKGSISELFRDDVSDDISSLEKEVEVWLKKNKKSTN